MSVKHTNGFILSFVLCLLSLLGYYAYTNAAADILATITTGLFVPQKPLNLAVSIGDTSVDLSWSAPYSDGGSVITDYVIEYKLSSSGTWVIFLDAVTTNTTATVTGLANDTAYDFRISAVNSIGQGTPSNGVSATPGSPAQVLITGMSDVSIPGITSSVRITNEGVDVYEYQYTWCVTNSDANLCGGGDDIFSSTAAKLIQSGENWDTTLNATVSSVGNYWFHLQVQFGSDYSYASQSFIATTQSGGGGGGGSSSSRSKTRSCIGGDINRDKKVNLVDFSIFLMFFGLSGPYSNPCVDINSDGKVSVIDFSILLTQWGKKPVVYKQI